jgi:hypothetical protein
MAVVDVAPVQGRRGGGALESLLDLVLVVGEVVHE